MWDGSDWHAVGSGISNDIHALAIDEVGDVYVGGKFNSVSHNGTTYANAVGIVKWDVSAQDWVELGTGLAGGFGGDVFCDLSR